MAQYQFLKTACAIPVLALADPETNAERIIRLCDQADQGDAGVVLFPELSLTGYSCGDLYAQSLLLKGTAEGLEQIVTWSETKPILIVVGAAIPVDGALYNCAVVINRGKVLGAVPKIHMPNSGEFYEKRWFASGRDLKRSKVSFGNLCFPIGTDLLFRMQEWSEVVIGIEICEDLWAPMPPSGFESAAGAVLILNPSASNELIGKYAHRHELVKQQAGRCNVAYCYCSSGMGESTTDVVFSGDAVIFEKGTLLAESERFSREGQLITGDIDVEALLHDRRNQSSFMDVAKTVEYETYREIAFSIRRCTKFERKINPSPFVPKDDNKRRQRCDEIISLQTMGLVGRLSHIGEPPMVVGISGGLDSTLALLICVNACDVMGIDRKKIHAVTMPGFGTTDRTYENAVNLIKGLGATFHEIPIRNACIGHFKDIGHDITLHNITYENAQARERTQILMDLANKVDGIVVGTGDLSELALGWATYNGDHMSMYGVNAGVPKTLIRYLVRNFADHQENPRIQNTLLDILDTPVSPELLPPDQEGHIAQKTEDLVGPYELHDFFLFHVLRNGFEPNKIFFMAKLAFEGKYTHLEIYKWLRNFYYRFFTQQFKRSCLPDGPKVGSVGLSPRGDWRMPSDAKVQLWLSEMDKIEKTLEEKNEKNRI